MDYDEFKSHFKCQNCGTCCTEFKAEAVSDDKKFIIYLLKLFRFPIPLRLVPDEIGITISIKKAVCKNFDPVRKICLDYLGRPELCRNYFCEKSKVKEFDEDNKDAM
jgi:Fe-S-cluster containining protein